MEELDMPATRSAATRVQAQFWRVVAPLPTPLWTPVGTLDRIYALVVRLSDGEGHSGVGVSHGIDGAALTRVVAAAQQLLAASGPDLAALTQVERREATWPDGNAHSRRAASALSFAVWDLLGKRAGLACADLWGRAPGREALDAYGSSMFLHCSEAELLDQAQGHRAAGYRRVKMRGGRPPEEDAARYELVRSVYPEPGCVAIDIYFQYDAERTRRFIRATKAPPMWVEDPIPYPDMAALAGEPLIAAGETCVHLDGLLALCRADVRNIILDVQELGGPLRFIEAARTVHALGHRVGSHTFAHESPHLLSLLPDSMPVEMLDWWNVLYNESPHPGADGRVRVRGPGLGVTLNEATLERYGEAVSPTA
jgi:L-alanine-DL-glutamate epimerase-like enolase superfamily enzyme